jgi:hypothetical protein
MGSEKRGERELEKKKITLLKWICRHVLHFRHLNILFLFLFLLSSFHLYILIVLSLWEHIPSSLRHGEGVIVPEASPRDPTFFYWYERRTRMRRMEERGGRRREERRGRREGERRGKSKRKRKEDDLD